MEKDIIRCGAPRTASETNYDKDLKRKLKPKVLPRNIRDWDLIMEHIKREEGN